MIVIVFLRNVVINRQDFGRYTSPLLSQCSSGQQILYRRCIPNPETNLGCLIDNTQTYNDIIIEERNC